MRSMWRRGLLRMVLRPRRCDGSIAYVSSAGQGRVSSCRFLSAEGAQGEGARRATYRQRDSAASTEILDDDTASVMHESDTKDITATNSYQLHLLPEKYATARATKQRIDQAARSQPKEAWRLMITFLVGRSLIEEARETVRVTPSVYQSDAKKQFEIALSKKQLEMMLVLRRAVRGNFQKKFSKWFEHPAIALLSRMMSKRGLANTWHLNECLKSCPDAATMVKLIRFAASQGVGTDHVTYNALSKRLMDESGNDRERMKVVVSELESEGLIETPKFFKNHPTRLPTNADFVRARLDELKRMHANSADLSELREQLMVFVRDGVASYRHLNFVMTKCGSPSEARAIMDEAAAQGLDIDVSTYNVLINAYVMAGQFEVARTEIPQEMRERNIAFDNYTRKALDFTPSSIGRRMSASLNEMRRRGDILRMKSLFQLLLRQNIIHVNHLNIVLDACNCATQSRELLEQVLTLKRDSRECNVAVNMHTVQILAKQLAEAGRFDEARAMIEFFAKNGVEDVPFIDAKTATRMVGMTAASEYNARKLLDRYLEQARIAQARKGDRVAEVHAQSLLNLYFTKVKTDEKDSSFELSSTDGENRDGPLPSEDPDSVSERLFLPAAPRKILSTELEDLVASHQTGKAIKRFWEVMRLRFAETGHLNTVMKGLALDEAEKLAEKATKHYRNPLTLDIVSYNTLLNAAKFFGTEEDCDRILKSMQSDGFSPDAFTTKALNLSETSVAKMHYERLRRLIRLGRIGDAHRLFYKIAECGKATTHHLNLVLASSRDRKTAYGMLRRAKRSPSKVVEDDFTKAAFDKLKK